MRKWCSIPVTLLILVALGLGGTGVAGAGVEHQGERIRAAFATFADPADCADGSCDAVALTAGYGTLGAASGKVRMAGLVIVELAPSTVVEGILIPAGPAVLSGCAYEADVAIARDLSGAHVATAGRIPLRDIVWSDDGTPTCTDPNGHWLDLNAGFSGVGDVYWWGDHHQSATPWNHEVAVSADASRRATAEAVIALDNAAPRALPAWPGSASLLRASSHGLNRVRDRAVGPAVSGPLHVTPNAALVKIGQGLAGDWMVDVMIARSPGGEQKVSLGVNGMIGGDFVWGGTDSAVVDLADDLSAGTASAVVMLTRDTPGGPVEVGEVAVSASWTGTGDAWPFRNSGGFRSPDGKVNAVTSGIHRDADLALQLGTDEIAGTGYLEAWTTKSAPKQG